MKLGRPIYHRLLVEAATAGTRFIETEADSKVGNEAGSPDGGSDRGVQRIQYVQRACQYVSLLL